MTHSYSDFDLQFGADPELFLKDTKTGKIVSGHDIVPGTKKKPVKLLLGSVQADGVALEINTPPARSGGDLHYYTITVLEKAMSRLKATDLVPVATPVARFTKEYFDELPTSAKELGCEPDYNAYTETVNTREAVNDNSETPFRTGAGHIHISWRSDNPIADPLDPAHFDTCCQYIRMADLFHEHIRHVYEVPDDSIRRRLYGEPGAFRPKPYGVEYRTPSNSWLKSPYAAKILVASMKAAFFLCIEGYDARDEETEKIVRAIAKYLCAGKAESLSLSKIAPSVKSSTTNFIIPSFSKDNTLGSYRFQPSTRKILDEL